MIGQEILSDSSILDIAFSHKVAVIEHFYPAFSFSNFISSIGGCLGFWLGVGVVQISGYGVTMILKILNYFKDYYA